MSHVYTATSWRGSFGPWRKELNEALCPPDKCGANANRCSQAATGPNSSKAKWWDCCLCYICSHIYYTLILTHPYTCIQVECMCTVFVCILYRCAHVHLWMCNHVVKFKVSTMWEVGSDYPPRGIVSTMAMWNTHHWLKITSAYL